MLAQEARRRRKMGGGLYFYRCKNEIYKFLRKSDKLDDIGEGGFFPTMSNWIKPVYATLDSDICRNCKARIFSECHFNLPDGQARSPHLNPLVKHLAIRLSPQAGKSLVIPQAGEEANEKGNFLIPANRGQHE
jgi:hypothetical protein